MGTDAPASTAPQPSPRTCVVSELEVAQHAVTQSLRFHNPRTSTAESSTFRNLDGQRTTHAPQGPRLGGARRPKLAERGTSGAELTPREWSLGDSNS